MRIMIPMAGQSRRFAEAGHEIPKPFIMIDGHTMIERVCWMFHPEDEFIFICNEEHLLCAEFESILRGITPHYQIVKIPPHEYGPVYSILQAQDFVKDETEPMIISYCDFTVEWNYRQFLLKAAQYEGALAVFRGFHPASFGDTLYAYVKANDKLEMLELREKKSYTHDRMNEFASTGIYYLESWKTFRRYAEELMKNKPEGLSEYYCSLLYNPMVRDGHRICLCEVDKFICWGTPTDLEAYFFWSRYFQHNSENALA